MNKGDPEQKGEDWNKYSAPVTSGKKVTLRERKRHLLCGPESSNLAAAPILFLLSSGTMKDQAVCTCLVLLRYMKGLG